MNGNQDLKEKERQARAKELISSLRTSATQITRTGLTFVAACAYFGVTAAATDHAALFAGTTLKLPLVDAQLPIYPFYSVAPAVIVLLHLNLLLVQLFFRRKLASTRQTGVLEEARGDSSRLLDALGVSLAVRAIILRRQQSWPAGAVLRIVFLVVNLILPLAVLLILEAQFLPRHSSEVLFWDRTLVVLDVLLVLYFVPTILDPKGTWCRWWSYHPEDSIDDDEMSCGTSRPGKPEGRLCELLAKIRSRTGLDKLLNGQPDAWAAKVLHWSARGAVFAILTGAVVISWCILTNPTKVPCEVRTPFDWAPWPTYHLDLSNRTVSTPQNMRLVDQDLRCADLSGLDLSGLDFRYSDLREARFDRANLRLARFGTPARGRQPPAAVRHRRDRTLVTGATFRNADLRGARLENLDLTGAVFTNALMDGSVLFGSKIRRGDLSGASLVAAVLDDVRMEGATLEGSRLTCASARSARLDLANARHIEAVAADLSDATALWVDFRAADLRGVRGLVLQYQSLLDATLDGACPKPLATAASSETTTARWPTTRSDERVSPPFPTKDPKAVAWSDLRGVSLNKPDSSGWASMREQLSADLELLEELTGWNRGLAERKQACFERFDRAERQWALEDDMKRCFGTNMNDSSSTLLDQEGAEILKTAFDWSNASAATPKDVQGLNEHWVSRLQGLRELPEACGDQLAMETLLERFFVLGHEGFEHIRDDLAKDLAERSTGRCPSLEPALWTLCCDRPESWRRVTAFLDPEGSFGRRCAPSTPLCPRKGP